VSFGGSNLHSVTYTRDALERGRRRGTQVYIWFYNVGTD
jgi:hypothetical protein